MEEQVLIPLEIWQLILLIRFIFTLVVMVNLHHGPAAGGWNVVDRARASSAGEPGNGGGGASDVRYGDTTLNHRVIVASGGGGGGEDSRPI